MRKKLLYGYMHFINKNKRVKKFYLLSKILKMTLIDIKFHINNKFDNSI
jgi:hypothetical protein